ncbi:DUF2235 domain-containing protein [Proteus sp. fly-1067]|uniref:T6SS phospholipase effector Tle1-like catalytic domain-containing protein n=1 Tax=Proteus sp. fly-1067 TaxID=3136674 RepID=UPI0032DAA911
MSKQVNSIFIETIETEATKAISTIRSQGDPCWAPPLFPKKGRLALTKEQISTNHEKLTNKEIEYYQNAKKQKKALCCKTLHVSLFFDGTNNNNYNDTEASIPPHPSNVAKLYHASSPEKNEVKNQGFYSYYISGVGTPFPDIGTDEYYSDGLIFATGGEARISWGLIQVCDAIYHAVTGDGLSLSDKRALLKEMSTDLNFESMTNTDLDSTDAFYGTAGAATMGILGLIVGSAYSKFNKTYNPVKPLNDFLKPLKWKISKVKPHIVALKIYAYGFSRGAAEARTFVYWLNQFLNYHFEELPHAWKKPCPLGTIYSLPVSVEFLGLFDTVAAVGLANVVPGATGHNGWASGTQQLPKSSLVKNICHLVAAHEQRQCFTVDSIRTPEGHYPPNSVEVIYPGVHSDIGGGYPAGDQGKARNQHKELLSQITLHDMYAAAIDAGAPLLFSSKSIDLVPNIKKEYSFLVMGDELFDEFAISEDLVDKFNSWRTYTLPEQSALSHNTTDNTSCFMPPRFAASTLEYAMEIQLILITAWRIGRYGTEQSDEINLTHQSFFKNAPQHSDILAQPYEAEFSKQATTTLALEYEKKIQDIAEKASIRNEEKKEITDLSNWKPSDKNMGLPLFDATNARGQLWEASLEFKFELEDLKGISRPTPLIKINQKSKIECQQEAQWFKKVHGEGSSIYQTQLENCKNNPEVTFPPDVISKANLLKAFQSADKLVYIATTQDERQEYLSLKAMSSTIFKKIMSLSMRKITQDIDLKNVISLLDDQIHDSRAWFMHSESGLREPFSSYFLSRMIYFGHRSNKSMQLIMQPEETSNYLDTIKLLGIAYKPLYGIIFLDLSTGKEIPIDMAQLPPPTYYLADQISELIKKQKKEELNNTMQDLQVIIEK